VPSGSEKVRSLDELTKPGVKIAIGSESVPVGSYTREVLSRLPASDRKTIRGNVRSEEPDVKGVIGKLTQSAVDAGFVYRSDVQAAKGRLEAIGLPARLQPRVAYGAGVVTGTSRRGVAGEYVKGLLAGACSRALRDAGLGPAPRR
jgi:molybdate transport system substrate-binding protein